MWVCVDSRGYGVTGNTPYEAYCIYTEEIGVLDFNNLNFYNLSNTPPTAMKMTIMPVNTP